MTGTERNDDIGVTTSPCTKRNTAPLHMPYYVESGNGVSWRIGGVIGLEFGRVGRKITTSAGLPGVD